MFFFPLTLQDWGHQVYIYFCRYLFLKFLVHSKSMVHKTHQRGSNVALEEEEWDITVFK